MTPCKKKIPCKSDEQLRGELIELDLNRLGIDPGWNRSDGTVRELEILVNR